MAKPPIFTLPQRQLLADVLRQVRQEERAHFDRRINEVIDQRGLIGFKGVWDEQQDYQRGAAVSVGGSLFIATAPCSAGERPGRGAGWKLAVKQGGK